MPVLFTRPYFQSEVSGGLDQSVDRFVKDYWVFDSGRVDPLARSRYEQQVLTLYEQDYIRNWDALLADLQYGRSRAFRTRARWPRNCPDRVRR